MPPSTQELTKKLRTQLRAAPEWYERLSLSLLGPDLSATLDWLTSRAAAAYQPERFTPPLKHLWRPFLTCPLPSLRVLVLADGPWTQLGQADGLALSCGQGPGVLLPPFLNSLLREVRGSDLDASLPPGSGDLTHWASQGVLLLNLSLTTGLDAGERSRRQHQQHWDFLVSFLLRSLVESHPHLPVLATGPVSEQWAREFEHSFSASTPKGIASQLMAINTHLLSQHQSPISWHNQ